MEHADVAVIGGGPAGAAAAIALSRAGMRCALLERSHYDCIRVGEILPPAVKRPLCALGVWDRFCRNGFTPSPGIVSAWGQPELYANDFIVNPYGRGWHVDRSRFDRMLADAAREAGATLHTGAQVVGWRRTERGWRIETRQGARPRWLQCDFVIDATGRTSWFARRLGHRRTGTDRLIAVVGLIDRPAGDPVRDRRALIESSPDGWWYSAELPGNRCVAAYMTDADLIARAGHGPEVQWWRARRAPYTDTRIGPTTAGVDIRVLTASTSKLDPVTDGDSWLAVGDAAIACDPLWGQGVVTALETGLAAAESATEHAALLEQNAAAQRRFHGYQRLRAAYYQRETRWPRSVFWARRHANPIT